MLGFVGFCFKNKTGEGHVQKVTIGCKLPHYSSHTVPKIAILGSQIRFRRMKMRIINAWHVNSSYSN